MNGWKREAIGTRWRVTDREKRDGAEQALQVIATKFTASYKAYALGKNGARNHVGNHKKSLFLSVEDSLKKLKTSYVSCVGSTHELVLNLTQQIDILYLHCVGPRETATES